MWQPIVIFAHVFIAVAIIALILLQQGKGADAGAAFGAGASGTVFGAKGSASFLSRATGILATLFFGTSLTLAYFQGDRSAPGGVLQGLEQSTPAFEAPADPISDLPAPVELPSAEDAPTTQDESQPES
ncbi:MAG: preprotein translocase subunit SecG [Gammaproteobacteria bacterium]